MSATRLVEWNVAVKRAFAGSFEIESSTTPWSIAPSASVAEQTMPLACRVSGGHVAAARARAPAVDALERPLRRSGRGDDLERRVEGEERGRRRHVKEGGAARRERTGVRPLGGSRPPVAEGSPQVPVVASGLDVGRGDVGELLAVKGRGRSGERLRRQHTGYDGKHHVTSIFLTIGLPP
jgi:hypothetical protein